MSDWIYVEDRPPSEPLSVIVGAINLHGGLLRRTMIAAHYKEKELILAPDADIDQGYYDDEDDEYYARPGWYEVPEFFDYCMPIDGDVIAWQYLPDPPKVD